MTGHEVSGAGTQMAMAAVQPSHEAWKAPSWLKDWSVQDQRVPATLHDVDLAIMATERALEPVDNERLGAGLAKLLNVVNPPTNSAKWPEVQERLREWWAEAKPVYVAALKDLPLDLLQKACIEVVKTHAFMPKAADIRKHVADELADRTSALLRLKLARDKVRAIAAPPVAPKQFLHEMTPEQRDRYDEIMARVGHRDDPAPKSEAA